MGEFVRVVGAWWLGAVLLFFAIIRMVSFNRRALFAGVAAVGLLIILVGAYRAYHRVSQERDELRARLKPDETRFTIRAAVPYAGVPFAEGRLIIPDVHIVNWSNASIDLGFTLVAADASGSFGTDAAWSQATFGGNDLPNPIHLEPHTSRSGRLVWLHGGRDLARYVIAGAVLRGIEELSQLHIDIPLPTSPGGFDYPGNTPAT